MERYLEGINYYQTDMDGVYWTLRQRGNGGDMRFLCSYHMGNVHKKEILEIGKVLMENPEWLDDPGKWHLHHIVEQQHYANIDFDGSLKYRYDEVLPCVLIHNPTEHSLYTRMARIRPTMEFFNGIGAPRRMDLRAKQAQEMGQSADGRKEMELKIRELWKWYNDLYRGDHILQKISGNVFKEALERLLIQS